jgi:hypothetical protein
MGKVLADWANGMQSRDLVFPVSALRKMPFHSLYQLGVEATVARYKLMDNMGF